MRKDIGYSIRIKDFDEIRVRMDAIIEAVEVKEVNRLSSVILKFCNFECS